MPCKTVKQAEIDYYQENFGGLEVWIPFRDRLLEKYKGATYDCEWIGLFLGTRRRKIQGKYQECFITERIYSRAELRPTTGIYCPLVNCEMCGRLGGKRHIKYRGDVHSWATPYRKKEWIEEMRNREAEGRSIHDPNNLCMSCYNKVKPIQKRKMHIEEIEIAIKQLNKEVKNAKSKDNRAI